VYEIVGAAVDDVPVSRQLKARQTAATLPMLRFGSCCAWFSPNKRLYRARCRSEADNQGQGVMWLPITRPDFIRFEKLVADSIVCFRPIRLGSGRRPESHSSASEANHQSPVSASWMARPLIKTRICCGSAPGATMKSSRASSGVHRTPDRFRNRVIRTVPIQKSEEGSYLPDHSRST